MGIGGGFRADGEPSGPGGVPDRLNGVGGPDQRRGALGKQRCEEHIVAAADQKQLDTPPPAEPPLEDAHRLQPGEATPEDHDAGHGRSSTPRSPATISPSTYTRSPAVSSAARATSAAPAGTTTT